MFGISTKEIGKSKKEKLIDQDFAVSIFTLGIG